MSFSVSVDPTNPGQFFACCGLLELADRLWPGAEGWFADGQFHVTGGGSLREMLNQLCAANLSSSLTDEELKTLASLLSAEKATLTQHQREEKERLRTMWQAERAYLSKPFDLWVDWWWDEHSGVKLLKTWAAKQMVIDIVRPLLDAIRGVVWSDENAPECLRRTAKVRGLPFYFDSATSAQSTPRDNGFAPYLGKEPTEGTIRPVLELCAFLGLQRFRPRRADAAKVKLINYSLWSVPLPVNVAPVAACGELASSDLLTYQFRMIFRTEYMKAFQSALPLCKEPNP